MHKESTYYYSCYLTPTDAEQTICEAIAAHFHPRHLPTMTARSQFATWNYSTMSLRV